MTETLKFKSGKRYTIDFDKHLGSGGFGSVYEGFNSNKDKFAIKKIKINATETNKDKSLKKIMNEINVLIKLTKANDENIMGYYDWTSYEDIDKNIIIYLVMEYISGSPLEGELTTSNAESLLLQCAKALKTIHSLGIVHRDIKPQNILLTDDGEIKIIDFGTGCVIITDPTIKICKGDPGSNGFYDPRLLLKMIPTACKSSDIYSLGMTFYAILTDKSIRDLPHSDVVFMTDTERLKRYQNIRNEIDDIKIPQHVKTVLKQMINPFGTRPSASQIITCIETHDCNATGYHPDCVGDDSKTAKPISVSTSTISKQDAEKYRQEQLKKLVEDDNFSSSEESE